MITIIAVLCIPMFLVLFYFFKVIKQFIQDYITLKKLPGPPRKNLIIGNIHHFHTSTDKMFEQLRKLRNSYYPIYQLSFLHYIAANILTAEDCELILSNPVHNNKSQIYYVFEMWLKNGLLTSQGKKWQIRRKILTSAFHFNILQQFIPIFNEETEELVTNLKKHCQESSINVNPFIIQFTLKTITESAMGTKLKFDTREEISYKQAIFDVGNIYVYRLIHPWLVHPIINLISPTYRKERKVTNTLHKFTKNVINQRQKTFHNDDIQTEEHEVYKGKKRLAMLDLLLTIMKKEGSINLNGIREEVDTFTFEGHDTTAVAISFALMLIACHKNVQDQIVQEMIEILGDLHKKPTYNDLQEMKYMERTIKEVLRYYPSVPLISRLLGEDVVTASGYLLPKNTNVLIHIYDIHHNCDLYPDPEKFDPDRFLPENTKMRHPFAYVPFSAGPRNCIGQRFAILELKTVLSGILANFILEPVDTPFSVVLVADIILRTKDGIKVKFVPRT